jgi:diaminopimelate epimerase
MKREFMKMHGAGNNFLVVEPSFFGMKNTRPK